MSHIPRLLCRRTRASILAAAILGLMLLSSCASTSIDAPGVVPGDEQSEASPTNVIFLIGDGMGLSQITAAKIELGKLQMERLTIGGFATTFASNRLVTDSAASGTALATGHKSYNGAISVSPDKSRFKTVLEHAEDRGMATGLVTTCAITHATPAAFASHVESREMYEEIARQMVGSGVDVMFGGGWSYFLPESQPGGARADGLNLLDDLRERMPVALSTEEFRMLPTTDAAAALLYPEHPPSFASRELPLAEMTRKALDILSRDEDGFFMMIEGSQIDWAGHENDHKWLIGEMADFDGAVGAVMDFAENDGSTLVVLTADHETGAYAVLDGSLEKRVVDRPSFATDNHSAAMVPVLAYGPGSAAFGGMMDNTDIGRALIATVTRGPAR